MIKLIVLTGTGGNGAPGSGSGLPIGRCHSNDPRFKLIDKRLQKICKVLKIDFFEVDRLKKNHILIFILRMPLKWSNGPKHVV